MNTGQMLLTLGAVFLLSMVILNVNKGLLWTGGTMSNNRVGILAVSVGTSIIEEAESKSFDEKTVDAAQTSPSALTPRTSLGLDTGELPNDPTTFDDFDDYNYYNKDRPRLDTVKLDIPGMNKFIIFRTICKVSYVSATRPDKDTTTQTWYKKLSVLVTSKDMQNADLKQDTVRLSTVYSFWYILGN